MPNDDSHDVQRRTLLKAAGAAGMFAAASGVTTATPGRRPGPKESEVLVGVSAGRDMASTVQADVPSEASIVHANETLRYVAVEFPDEAGAAKRRFMEQVQKRRGVKYAEINTTHETQLEPNDPEYGSQYAPQQVNAPTAWDTTTGSSSVTLAIVDTGAQYTHPDLDPNFGSDPGQDFVDDDGDPAPDAPSSEYHGTHVSGIAGAATNNGTDVAGISDCTLINGRALDENGTGSTADIADAVEWAADQGADVVNMSLGGGGYTETMKTAVQYAVNNGCLPICAAGNGSGNPVSYPAAYSECMAVSALDENENLASYSNVGPEIDVAAPGSNVLSTTTQTRGGTEELSGTSMATPVVTGVAGLVESQWGDLSPTELRNHLTGTAVDVDLADDEQGCGRVDAANAVGTDPANRSTDCGGGGGEDPPEDPPGSCGDSATSETVSDYLSGSSDYDCWSWNWEFASPCEVVVELDGPATADFDLYVLEGSNYCPSPWNYDYNSISPDSQETITIENPDTSTPLQIDVESYSGSGSYDLTITERSQ